MVKWNITFRLIVDCTRSGLSGHLRVSVNEYKRRDYLTIHESVSMWVRECMRARVRLSLPLVLKWLGLTRRARRDCPMENISRRGVTWGWCDSRVMSTSGPWHGSFEQEFNLVALTHCMIAKPTCECPEIENIQSHTVYWLVRPWHRSNLKRNTKYHNVETSKSKFLFFYSTLITTNDKYIFFD